MNQFKIRLNHSKSHHPRFFIFFESENKKPKISKRIECNYLLQATKIDFNSR